MFIKLIVLPTGMHNMKSTYIVPSELSLVYSS